MPGLETSTVKGFIELMAIGIAVGILIVALDSAIARVAPTALPLAA